MSTTWLTTAAAIFSGILSKISPVIIADLTAIATAFWVKEKAAIEAKLADPAFQASVIATAQATIVALYNHFANMTATQKTVRVGAVALPAIAVGSFFWL